MGYRISWIKQTVNNFSSMLRLFPRLYGGIIVILIVFGLGIWGMQQQKVAVHQPLRALGEKIDPTCPIVIRGISYHLVKEGRRVYYVKADEFKINPRAFGVFLIQPIKEATLVNAFIEVYLSTQGNPAQEVDLFPSFLSSSSDPEAKKLSMAGIGVITRGVFKNLHLNIYKNEKLSIVVVAAEAITSFTKKETVLKGVQIEHKVSKKFIKAQSVTWDANENIFKIPGEYIAETPKGTAKGYGIKVTLDFAVAKMP